MFFLVLEDLSLFNILNVPGGRIRLKEGNAKSFCLKSNLEKDFAAAVYFSEAISMSPPLLCVGFGVVKQFCRL